MWRVNTPSFISAARQQLNILVYFLLYVSNIITISVIIFNVIF